MAAVGCTVVATSQRVQLGDISLEEGCSGWRNLDPERVTQLADEFRAGNWGVGLHRPVRLLKSFDAQSNLLDNRGLILVDDGLHTLSVLTTLKKAFENNADDVVCPKLRDMFQNGIPVDFVSYSEDSRDLRIMCQTLARDSESNSYKEPSEVCHNICKRNVVARSDHIGFWDSVLVFL